MTPLDSVVAAADDVIAAIDTDALAKCGTLLFRLYHQCCALVNKH